MGNLSFGRRLSELLREKAISQYEFAIACNLTPGTLSRYINDKTMPNVNVISTMSKILKVSPDYLINGSCRSNDPQRSNVIEYVKIKNREEKYDFRQIYDIIKKNEKYLNIKQKLAIINTLFTSNIAETTIDKETRTLFKNILNEVYENAKKYIVL